MNYQHVFHAGNFADVFKHCVLTALVQSFFLKDKPICYLDTHAGAGVYELSSKPNAEYINGIARIYSDQNPPKVVADYLQIIKNCNQRFADTDELRWYPGSPYLAQELLRPTDRLILVDKVPDIAKQLKYYFANNKQAAVHQRDGWEALKAFLPPKENRGLVLIDPPYEDPNEFKIILQQLELSLKRWPTGVYVVWYPIVEKQRSELFLHNLKRRISCPYLVSELLLHSDIPIGLNGCGMVILNPPWRFEETLQSFVPWLRKQLAVG